MSSSHPLCSFVQHSWCLAWREATGSAGGENNVWEGTWVISNMSLNTNSSEPEAMGLAHSLARWGRTAGMFTQVGGWTKEKGGAEAALDKMAPSCT